MNKKDFLHAFEELLEIELDTLSGEETLASLKSWDSLTVLGFIAFADQHFEKAIPSADIGRARTVNDLINLFGNDVI